MSEDPESAPESTSSIEHPSSEEEGAEDEDTESEGDMNSGESGELPLYDGSTLTSANFDALLLALFKKHRMSAMIKKPTAGQLKEKSDEKGLVYVYSQLSKYTAELSSQEQACEFQLKSIPKTLKLKE